MTPCPLGRTGSWTCFAKLSGSISYSVSPLLPIHKQRTGPSELQDPTRVVENKCNTGTQCFVLCQPEGRDSESASYISQEECLHGHLVFIRKETFGCRLSAKDLFCRSLYPM